MSDILGGIGDALGGVADGVGKAIDFFAPSVEARGRGFNPTDLMNSLADTVKGSALGALGSVDDVLQGEGSLRDKLFMGGMIAAGVGGTVFGAHEVAAAKKASALEAGPMQQFGLPDQNMLLGRAVRRSSPRGEAIGLRQRAESASIEGAQLIAKNPGLSPRMGDILAAPDAQMTASHLVGASVAADPLRLTNSSLIVNKYTSMFAGVTPDKQLAAAQEDLVKVDNAVRSGIIVSSHSTQNEAFVEQWKQFLSGDLLPGSGGERQMLSMVKQFGDQSRGILAPDMTFNIALGLDSVVFTTQGPLWHVSMIDQAEQWTAFQETKFREVMFRSLNVRAQSAQGKKNIERMMDDALAHEAGTRLLPAPLKRGSGSHGKGWYWTAASEIDAALPQVTEKVSWANKEVLTAAVSLSSAAADWEDNIELAVQALLAASDDRVSSDSFQSFLRGYNPRDKEMSGPEFDLLQKLYSDVGNVKLSKPDFVKILRLAKEHPDDLFKSTNGPKQKNFYGNLMDPLDTSLVTVDRHMHDMFFGIASGSDFKMLGQTDLSDLNYDIVADIIKQIADERGMLPSMVQGLAWEAWKVQKESYRSIGQTWPSYDPFRLKDPVTGAENEVFRALTGELNGSVSDVLKSTGLQIPFVLSGKGHGLAMMPDDTLGVLAKPSKRFAQMFRHMFPAFTRSDGSAMWGAGAPRRVRDVYSFVQNVASRTPGGVYETWNAQDWDRFGGHPVTRPEVSVMVDIADGYDSSKLDKLGLVMDPGVPVATGFPTRSRERLGPDDLTSESFADPAKSPLVTHEWASISSEVNDSQMERFGLGNLSKKDLVARYNELGAKLRAAGYKPIPQRGMYKGEGEPSWLVFGISPEEASHFGDMFHQDSVITNDGMWYGKTAVDPEMAGKVQNFEPGVRIGGFGHDDFHSALDLPGGKVTWSAENYYWDGKADEADAAARWDQGEQGRARRIGIRLKASKAQDLLKTIAEIEGEGHTVKTVHAPGQAPKGWTEVRDHLVTDGSSLHLSRSRDPEIHSSNGFSAWVRSGEADGLPERSTLAARPVPEPGIRQVSENRFVVNGALVLHAGDAQDVKVVKQLDPRTWKSGSRKPVGVLFNTTGPVDEIVPVFNPERLVSQTGTDKKAAAAAEVDVNGDPVPAPPAELDLGAEVAPGQLMVKLTNGKYTIDLPLNNPDMRLPHQFIEAVGHLGIKPEDVRVNVGEVAAQTVTQQPRRIKGFGALVTGEDAPELRLTGAPEERMAQTHGVRYYPSYRDQTGRVVTIDPVVSAELAWALDRFASSGHKSLLERARLDTVSLQMGGPKDLESAAWYQRGTTTNGSIVLNADHWRDMPTLLDGLAKDQASGFLQPTMAGAGARVYIAHELGHVTHQALRASFMSSDAADQWEKDVLKPLMKSYGKKRIIAELSEYGNKNLLEFLAEAFCEAIFSDAPRQMAKDVYGLAMEQFEKNMNTMTPGGFVRK